MISISDTITILETPPLWPKSGSLRKYIQKCLSRTLSSLRTQAPLSPFWTHVLSHPLELNILLSHDLEIQALNAQWRGKDVPTNVLSFPSLTPLSPISTSTKATMPLFVGDMILSYETCFLESQNQKKKIDHHLAHLVVHGLLHLFGMDHQDQSEAHIMESLEIDLLKPLGIFNPYQSAT